MRQIGRATIQKVEELCGPGFKPDIMFPKYDAASFDAQRAWMEPEFIEPGSDRLIGSIHTWVVRTGQHTILIDTCLGNHKTRSARRWHQLNTPFLERLAAAGVQPEDVDFVMCTHLHVDHVGWNTQLVDGRWVPTFPKAKYLFATKEYAHWEAERKTHAAAEVQGGAYDDSVLPIVEAKRAVFIDAAYQADDLLTLIDTRATRRARCACNCATVARRPCSPATSCITRSRSITQTGRASSAGTARCRPRAGARVLEHCVEHDSLLCPAHFPGPNAGHVHEKNGQFSMAWDRR